MKGILRRLAYLLFDKTLAFIYKVNIQEHMGRQHFFYNAFRVLSFNGIDGDYVEFGCHGAGTITLAYQEMSKHGNQGKLWAFDSFQGLPAPQNEKDDHPHWKEHHMSTGLDKFHKLCKAFGIPTEVYEAVPGYYKDTLPMLSSSGEPTNIALAYIDCDLYSSTMDVLQFLVPRLKHGMIIAFDDYYCWSKDQISGERQAMSEIFPINEGWKLIPYSQIGWHGQSFIVEDVRVGSSS